MSGALDISNESNITLIPAESLREMTVTKEALFKRQKENVLQELMEAMVNSATNRGSTGYIANLNPQFDATMLAEIVAELSNLGYKVVTEAKNDEKVGSFIAIEITW